MKRIFAAIAAAVKAVAGAGKWVLKQTAKGAIWTLEAPFILAGHLLHGGGGGSHEPDERDVAQQAAQQTRAQQQQADTRSEVDARAQCVMRLARALRDGKDPDPEDAAQLSPAHVRYLQGLKREELEIVAAASMSGIRARRAFVCSMTPPDGCRPFEAVARDMENSPVTPSEHRFRTLADKLRARKLGATVAAEQEADTAAIVRKYAKAAA